MRLTFVKFRQGLIASALLLGSSPARAAFDNATESSGITNIQALITDNVDNHGGAAAVDVDGDGFTDLLLARFNAPPLLYMNQGNGQFVDEAAERGLAGAFDAAAFGAGDFDNDGDPDLLIVPYNSNRFLLYINDGDGNFTEEAIARGADTTVEQIPHDGYSVGLVDYNRDGFLDIFVSQWGIGYSSESDRHSVLLRNVGSDAPGHFVNVTKAAGLVHPDYTGGQFAFSSGWADFDSDGWPDLALVSDFARSKMYWNDGDGTFTETTSESGVGLDQSGMGVAIADYDGDGLLDFYVTAIFDELHCNNACLGSMLYRNLGNRLFQEVSQSAGVDRPGWGWGASFFEYDNDGDFDLVVTNGMPVPEGGIANPASAYDPTTLFVNQGDGTFTDDTRSSGIMDTRYGRALIVLDYDNDGDEDLIVVNAFSNPIVYRSDASTNGNDWIRFTFEGTISNRDGIGCLLKITEGGKTQTLVYNPSNAYIGQREAVLHFGLGNGDGSVDSVAIQWPSGISQTITNVATNQVHHLVEPDDGPLAPFFSLQPTVAGPFELGERLTLKAESIGVPAPAITWQKDGETIEGATGSTLHIKSISPFESGVYRAMASSSSGEALSVEVAVEIDFDMASRSVARWWNEFMLEAIRRDFPDPTKHSRNLYHVSAAMWDAFWPYQQEQWTVAAPVFHKEEIPSTAWGSDREAAQSEAISHAAYTVLARRYQNSPGAESSLFDFRWLMERLGFDPDFTSLQGDSPAAVGNRIGNSILETNYSDGSNELDDYADTSGYQPVNDPLPVELSGTQVVDINRWQPLLFENAVSQNGIPIGQLVQTFLGVNWREVDTFALRKTSSNTIAFDPGPPPLLGDGARDEFIDAIVEVIRYSSRLDPDDGEMIDISPGALLNNTVGANDGTGRPLNPFNGLPYAENLVKRADYGRILAEFWADGPASETPPGHWNTLHNEITESPFFEPRYMGVGPELPALEWDVRAYLALNGGMHDAAVAAWTLKRQYDYSRPVTMIRYLGGNGQSSDPNLPSYHEDGLPLVPGLVELVDTASSAEGERHAHLAEAVGKVAILAWAGEPEDPETQVGGVDWILPEDWLPYQRDTFVTPAFAAYVSGHSAFSRAGAEVLTLLTGSPYFPAGMGQFHFLKSEFLEFEDGPSADVTLQWATYYDAADQAGVSRLHGGIHVRADDFVGRILGARIGVEAFIKAHTLRNAASGTGLLDEVVTQQKMTTRNQAQLVRFEIKGKPLPLRLAASLDETQEGNPKAIYIVIPDSSTITDTNEITFLSNSGLVQGIEINGQIGASDKLTINIVVNSNEPILLLATGRGANLENGAPDTILSVFEKADGQWVELASNDDWHDNETVSLSEVLMLRGNRKLALEETESALALALASGAYRFVLESKGLSGAARLSITGQSWKSN